MTTNVTDSSFDEQVLKSELPVLVDFWAPWCSPCIMLAPVIDEITKEYEGKINVCKLSVEENAATASRYGIVSIPTLIIFKNGQIAEQIVGVVPKERIEEKIKLHIE